MRKNDSDRKKFSTLASLDAIQSDAQKYVEAKTLAEKCLLDVEVKLMNLENDPRKAGFDKTLQEIQESLPLARDEQSFHGIVESLEALGRSIDRIMH